MEAERFDGWTRALAGGASRRRVLRGLGGALGTAALAALGRGARVDAAPGGNGACARFCAQVFGADTPAAGQCTSQAAHGQGLCTQCGPASDGTLKLCGTTCIPASSCCTSADCGGATDCLAPVCTQGGCGTAPTNEGGSCNGGTGTCQSGTCVPNSTCVGANQNCATPMDTCCVAGSVCSDPCGEGLICCSPAGASCTSDCACCGSLICSSDGRCVQ